MSLWNARYAVFAHVCPHGDPNSVEVSVLKGWFSKRELRTESKNVLRACFPVGEGLEERERVSRALESAAAALRAPRD